METIYRVIGKNGGKFMTPECFMFLIKSKNTLENLSLSELEREVFEITKKQNSITHWELSSEVTSLVIKELQEKKKDLLEAMHIKVDCL